MQPLLLLTLLPLVLALPASDTASSTAPVIVPTEGAIIPGKYVVKLKSAPGIHLSAISLLENLPIHVYDFGNFRGFAADIRPEVVDRLKRNPDVCQA